jgi:hypothetical protein
MALRSVLGTYLEHLPSTTKEADRFKWLVERILLQPLHDYDRLIPAEDVFRLAAGVYLAGVKQPSGRDSIFPAPVRSIYETSPELQARFPEPLDISVPENLLSWAKREGARAHPSLAAYFAELPRFAKRTTSSWDRGVVRSWPVEIDRSVPDPRFAGQVTSAQAARIKAITARLRQAWRQGGAAEVLRKSARRVWWRLANRAGLRG